MARMPKSKASQLSFFSQAYKNKFVRFSLLGILALLLLPFALNLLNLGGKQTPSTPSVVALTQSVKFNGSEYECTNLQADDKNNIEVLFQLVSMLKESREKLVKWSEDNLNKCGTEEQYNFDFSDIPLETRLKAEALLKSKPYSVKDFQECREFWEKAKQEDYDSKTKEIQKWINDGEKLLSKGGCTSKKLSESEAIKIVSNLPEVKEFEKLLEGVNKPVSFRVIDGNNYWSIQVYEDVKDSETEGHSATFGWYKVDKNTRGVTK